MVNALDVAHWMLARANEAGVRDVTNMKLNKLVYFAHAHTLGATGRPLYVDETQAWDHGPVVQDVYNSYRGSRDPIPDAPASPMFDAATLEILEAVWQQYGKLSAGQLRSRSHQDAPWKVPYGTGVRFATMPIEHIRDYYHRHLPATQVILSTHVDYLDDEDMAVLDAADSPETVAAAVAYLLA